jgi:hypothetical protein
MARVKLQRQDGEFLLLDSEAADNGAPDDPSMSPGGAYFRGHDLRFCNLVVQNAAGAGTADVEIYYSDLDAPTVAGDWAKDENIGSFALAVPTRELRFEHRGYKWGYVRALNQAGGALVTVVGHVSG